MALQTYQYTVYIRQQVRGVIPICLCLTESALVKVHDDILRASDNQNSVIILLLDLSAAFDTVDHSILLSRLKSRFGMNGIALDWFRSYLPNRTYTVTVLGGRSTDRPLMTGVPQGSVLGPILFRA